MGRRAKKAGPVDRPPKPNTKSPAELRTRAGARLPKLAGHRVTPLYLNPFSASTEPAPLAQIVADELRRRCTRVEGLAILFQAAAAVLITSFKADAAVSMFELAASEMADELGSLIGVGAVRQ